jgi:hypothetical protein
MGAIFNTFLKPVIEFLGSKTRFRVFLIALLAITALSEFMVLGLARRTFVFYTVRNGDIVVEDRMLKKSPTRQEDIVRYTEETLLGPVSPDLLPLFPYGTRLKSLLYRDGVVYADFSADALLPPEEGGSVLNNFRTLKEGILRNFSSVRDVRFFIDGHAAFYEEFHGEIAGNVPETAPQSVR